MFWWRLRSNLALRNPMLIDFAKKLHLFKLAFSGIYTHHRIYGAVAAIEFVQEIDRYAYRQGLFVHPAVWAIRWSWLMMMGFSPGRGRCSAVGRVDKLSNSFRQVGLEKADLE